MKTVALVGVGGLVGDKLYETMQNGLANQVHLRLFGHSIVGKRKQFGTKWATVEPTANLLKGQIDYALFAADEQTSRSFVPQLANKGTVCIDNSSVFRMQQDVPLVVPSINICSATNCKVIANPNCVTIPVAMVLHQLVQLCPTALTVVTYQSASGAGKNGLADLTEKRKPPKTKAFCQPLYDNVIPQIGDVLPSGYTAEENKLLNEIGKLFDNTIDVNSFCVRVPVTVGHGAFVNVKFRQKCSVHQAKRLLAQNDDIVLFGKDAPTPQQIRNSKFVGVGRLTQVNEYSINMFVVADNLLRGAAYNSYEILTFLLKAPDQTKQECWLQTTQSTNKLQRKTFDSCTAF